jgi:hypothetical protein
MTRIAPSENHPTQFQRESLDTINSLVALIAASSFWLMAGLGRMYYCLPL